MRPSGGFTLIEVVLATALAASLMVAVLSVTASLGRSQQAFAREATEDDGRAELIELLRRDLAQAQEARFGKASAELIGYGALDPTTLEPTQRPARVTYRLSTGASGSWLVREQTLLDQNQAEPWREIVAWGVSGWEIKAVRQPGAGTTPSLSGTLPGAGAGAGAGVPDEVQLEVVWSSGKSIRQVIRVK